MIKREHIVAGILLALGFFLFTPQVFGFEKLPIEIRIADDPRCSFCEKLRTEMYGENGRLWSVLPPFAQYGVEMTFFQYGYNLSPTPETWPQWFKDEIISHRLNKPRGTPTIYIWNTETDVPLRVITGFRGVQWVTSQIMAVIEVYKQSHAFYPVTTR